ncbi:nuclear transport factor 2 family protein [Winogradskyella sp.]|uniref:nuclear transport factor 2 family protein n=1 Tax=Winogradskyella sp. TaxID=1883156 RepID=UPI003BABE3A4
MKLLKLFGLLVFMSCQITMAQNETMDVVKQVLNAQSARFSAITEANVEQLKSLLADELSYSHATGLKESKSEYLETISSKRVEYVSLVPKDIDVRMYENIAVLTGLVDVKLVYNEKKMAFTLRFLEVQREVEGVWLLVAWQSVKNQN